MSEVRSDSLICIKKSGLRTIILEGDFEICGYKAAGWTAVKNDWTKDRIVKPSIDAAEHMALTAMAKDVYRKK